MSKVSMYFKTAKNTETGKKFSNLKLKIDEAREAQNQFSEKYGFHKYRPDRWEAFGGIEECHGFEKEPDPKLWRLNKGGGYVPKKNTKEGKAIFEEMKGLPVLTKHDVNMCINFESGAPFRCIGFSIEDDEYNVFTLNKEWNCSIPNDCIEITASEFQKLYKD